MAEPDGGPGAGRGAGQRGDTADVDSLAWQILSDLLTPDGAFATFPPEGLQRLVEMRLEEEAAARGIPTDDLGRAFERAIRELTGKDGSREADGGEAGGEASGGDV